MNRRHFFKTIVLGSVGLIVPSISVGKNNELKEIGKQIPFSLVHFRLNGKEYRAKILLDGVNKEKTLDYMDGLYAAALRTAEKVY